MRRGLLLLAATVLVACPSESDDGGGAAPVDVAPTFAEIDRDVFAKRCTAACHSGGEFAAGGLDMEGDAFAALVDGPPIDAACQSLGLSRVAPGDPERSLLYLKIAAKTAGTPAPCGESMPSGANKAALTEDEVARVRAWILAGARDD